MSSISSLVCYLLVVCLLTTTVATRPDYTGYQVVQVIPNSAESLKLLFSLEERGIISFWNEPTKLLNSVASSFHISSENYEQLAPTFGRYRLNPLVVFNNVQELLDERDQEIIKRKSVDNKAFDLLNFHTYPEIIAFMQETAANNTLATYSVIGKSYEGRDIGQMTISSTSSPVNSTKQIIFLECGVHAREWVAHSSCIWILDQLVNGYGIDAEITQLVNKYDWTIVPTSNPDGYEYTWNTDRLWRKSRAPTNNASCIGVDINRNYNSNFGGEGSSDDGCSDNYHGESAFSESESASIRDSLVASRGRIKAFISIHSNRQVWMTPYGYSLELPPDYDEMIRVVSLGAEAIAATNGIIFPTGIASEILYFTSGGSRDYAYVTEQIVYSSTIEARSMDYGFVAPLSEIYPTAQEIWNGIKAVVNAVV